MHGFAWRLARRSIRLFAAARLPRASRPGEGEPFRDWGNAMAVPCGDAVGKLLIWLEVSLRRESRAGLLRTQRAGAPRARCGLHGADGRSIGGGRAGWARGGWQTTLRFAARARAALRDAARHGASKRMRERVSMCSRHGGGAAGTGGSGRGDRQARERNLAACYRWETRWAKRPFWRRRRGRGPEARERRPGQASLRGARISSSGARFHPA